MNNSVPTSPEEWSEYWQAKGFPWRTEPEIDAKQQKELAERRALIIPDIKKGIYPFKDMKLSRADVEWLLSTHESDEIIGPVDWGDESQRKRQGVDLRGADLSKSDLSGLLLACMHGGYIRRNGVERLVNNATGQQYIWRKLTSAEPTWRAVVSGEHTW